MVNHWSLVSNAEKGIKLDGFKPVIVNIAEVSANDLWIHDESRSK
jgi:hypothetical protein